MPIGIAKLMKVHRPKRKPAVAVGYQHNGAFNRAATWRWENKRWALIGHTSARNVTSFGDLARVEDRLVAMVGAGINATATRMRTAVSVDEGTSWSVGSEFGPTAVDSERHRLFAAGGLFFAAPVGLNHASTKQTVLYVSSDGVSWTPTNLTWLENSVFITAPEDDPPNEGDHPPPTLAAGQVSCGTVAGVAHDGSERFVAIAGQGLIYNNFFSEVDAGPNPLPPPDRLSTWFYAANITTRPALVSSDGVTWSAAPSLPTTQAVQLNGLMYFKGVGFVAQGFLDDGPQGAYSSADGEVWTRQLETTTAWGSKAIARPGGYGMAVSGNFIGGFSSGSYVVPDRSYILAITPPHVMNDLAFTGDNFVAGGHRQLTTPLRREARVYSTRQGTQWREEEVEGNDVDSAIWGIA